MPIPGCSAATWPTRTYFGIDRRDYIGKRVLDLDFLPEELRQVCQAEDERIIAEVSSISREMQLD